MRQQTWFAVIICTIAVIPGFIVGGILKILMYAFGGWAENSDFLFLHALFGVETPGAIYNFIFARALPNGVQAFVAGGVAVWVAEKIARDANHRSAAMVTGALYTGFLICLVVLSVARVGVSENMLLSICQGIGLWIGLWSAAASLPVYNGALANG